MPSPTNPGTEAEPARSAATRHAMPPVARHPMRHVTQVRVVGVLDTDARILPAHGNKPSALELHMRPQRGLPYWALMPVDDGEEAPLASWLPAMRRGTLLSVGADGQELHQVEGRPVLKLIHPFGILIP